MATKHFSKFPLDLSGYRFSRLVVIHSHLPVKNGDRKRHFYACRCDCGTVKDVERCNLTSGHTQSCGCFYVSSKITHGMSNSSTYRSWKAMKERCTNPNHKYFENDGGRGITVCNRWRNSFEAFLEDMGEKPSKTHSLDRKNNDLGYDPENCRWASERNQRRNRRGNVMITYKGETKILADWAYAIGINKGTLRDRLERGWSVEKAFKTPAMHK